MKAELSLVSTGLGKGELLQQRARVMQTAWWQQPVAAIRFLC